MDVTDKGGHEPEQAVMSRAAWAEVPASPDLPLLASRADPERRNRRVLLVPADVGQRLKESAREAGLQPDIALLAGVAEVIRAWAGQPAFTLGFRPGGRAPGPTVTVTARRAGLEFADRAAALGAQAEAAHSREGAPPPVTMTGLLAAPVADSETAELIDVAFTERSGGLEMTWDVAAGAFPPGMTDAMSGACLRLLSLLGTDRAAWHARRFDLVPDGDRELVARVNATSAPVPRLLLQEYLAAGARRHPSAEAVVDVRARLTYRELFSYANRIGRRLREGEPPVLPGELVAIVMHKGWEQYAAVYGVLTAGGAYMPVDPSVPPARLGRLLTHGRVRHVLTQSWLDERLSWPPGVTRHRVDTGFASGDDRPLLAGQVPTDLAYVIATSGSTGEPKGVAVDHRGVVNMVTDVNARFGIGTGDRAFAISGLHFDASVYDVFGVIAAGATAVLPEPFERAQPDRWVSRMADESVTLWNSVPPLMEMLAGHAEMRDDQPLRTLRLAVLSGDWIPLTLPDRLRALAPGVSVVGSGGPTETICWSVFYPIGQVEGTWRSIPYGKPISNQRYYIVDDELRQRPVGVPGQMAVASDIGLARGYWDDEARTRERFVTLPETGQRAYLTGDLGRYLPDGNIEILGRDDFQVKIQGYRIELGEIEAALREHPAVRHAVVIAPVSGTGGVRRLHGFVTLRADAGDAPADPEDLRSGLLGILPRYLVPATITVLDTLPLTGNGKVDRLSLTARATGGTTAGDQGAGPSPKPRTALEALIAAAMAEVLGLDHVGPMDNFFRLGGDSVGGVRVLRRIHELTGVDIPLKALFGSPVIANLAADLAADTSFGADVVAAADRLERLLEAALATPVPAPR